MFHVEHILFMETLNACPICQSGSFTRISRKGLHRIRKRIPNRQVRGMRTALYESSSNEVRDWAILREPRLYQSFQQQKGLINNIYQWVRNRAIKEKLALVHKFSGKRDTIKLLDIGCGTGEFLASAKASGMQTKGIEPSAAARGASDSQPSTECRRERA